MTVLDASAVLAMIHDERGSDVVAGELAGAVLGAANLAEVVGKLVDADIDVARVRELLSFAGVTVDRSVQRMRNSLARCARSPAARHCHWATDAASP